MPVAEIITIGTEILLGEILDTNTHQIAQALRGAGVDLYWTTTVGDNEERIAEAVHRGFSRSEVIITTGGLGPTIDDATRQGVARALGVGTEYRPELWDQILERYRRFGREPTENNKRQAHIPTGAIAIENPVGTAPSFLVEQESKALICLPGVPREMAFLMEKEVLPYIKKRFPLEEVILIRLIHTAGVGESQIDDRIIDLEKLANPTVGLAAHTGQVDVRITAKAGSEEDARAMIQPVEAEVRDRLGTWIYGADQETLESVALSHLARKGLRLTVLEAGIGCAMARRVAGDNGVFLQGRVIPDLPEPGSLMVQTAALRDETSAEVALGLSLHPGEGVQTLYQALISPKKQGVRTHSYGGPPGNAPLWAVNISLNLLRTLESKYRIRQREPRG
jgi:competence/damage-inducible protein CinA-like protein